MKFQEAVFTLNMKHDEIWFYADTGNNDLTHCDKWKKGEIRSTCGTLLAMQTGHPDEWELTTCWGKKDTGLVIDEPDEISAITTQFIDDVKVHMTHQVYPYIDDAIGVYTPPDDDESWNW